jgi:hypothetical protein
MKSSYADITEKQTSKEPIILVEIESEYRNEKKFTDSCTSYSATDILIFAGLPSMFPVMPIPPK